MQEMPTHVKAFSAFIWQAANLSAPQEPSSTGHCDLKGVEWKPSAPLCIGEAQPLTGH
jgi:hypothetical protein